VLLDEVFAVDDAGFKKKSMKMMETYLENKTLVLVSHNMKQVLQICSRIIVLEGGGIVYDGEVEKGIEHYNTLMGSSRNRTGHTLLPRNLQKGFAEEPAVTVERIDITGLQGDRLETIRHGQKVVLYIYLKTKEVLSDLMLKVVVKRSLMDTFSDILGQYNMIIKEENLIRSKEVKVSFCTNNLVPGTHTIEIVPQYIKQPLRAALDSYSECFDIVSETAHEAEGLINLNFSIEE
jgi:ABC-type multidrug transport system ATPase subunit